MHLLSPCINAPKTILTANSSWKQLQWHPEIAIEWILRYTGRICQYEFGGSDRVTLEVHWQSVFMISLRCSWMPWLSQLYDKHGAKNEVSRDI